MARIKKGDTLIEVTIAIGIFSMIAIAVASVMSSGTSGSQTALETTLAREEIDAQAEALRFVQSAYINARNDKSSSATSTGSRYESLWKKIAASAIDLADVDSAVTQFAPSSCEDLYNKDSEGYGNIFQQKAFILNPKQLSNGDSAFISVTDPSVSAKFAPTTTYPHLIFGDSGDDNDSTDSLVSTTVRDNLYQAAGIYVVAVRDADTTTIINAGDKPVSAFYDFYIRTCWYGTDATRPSTISTVVRLYDPDIRVNK